MLSGDCKYGSKVISHSVGRKHFLGHSCTLSYFKVIEIMLIKVLLGPPSCAINISKSIKSVQNARSSGVTAFMLE